MLTDGSAEVLKHALKVMSGLAGIYNFNNEPVDKDFLSGMGRALATRSPDGESEVSSGSTGLIYRAFDTNHQSCLQRQPMVSRFGHILCWDGRLDNRDELISSLEDYLHGNHSDVAIVLGSYLKWGANFAAQLIGDFALSLWDSHSKTLILARDPIGTRLLYYHSDNYRIIWSSELASLIDLPGLELAINEEYIADYLVRYPEPGQTPYKNILAVPPAHLVIAKNGKIKVECFWKLNHTRRIRYRADEEYEEHFRYLFREAVRCRLRSDRPVWAELSGGLDSSTIVCMADDIIKSGEAEAPGLETVSRVFDEAAGSDERKYIGPVEDKIGRKGLYLREDDHGRFTSLEEKYCRIIPNPNAPLAEYYKALGTSMRRGGARVLLAGKGGDEILTSTRDPSPELAELLLSFRFLTLHQRLQIWSKSLRKPYFLTLWERAVSPLLPDQVVFNRKRAYEVEVSKIFGNAFLKRMDLLTRMRGSCGLFGFWNPIANQQSQHFQTLVRSLSAGFHQGLIDVEITYPYTHRPLIEFMLAIPFDQRVRPTETRSIARRALRDLLPTEVASRRSKGLSVHAALRGMAREWQRFNELFTDSRICANGYINPATLRNLLESARHGKEQKSTLLIPLLFLEYWLRSFECLRSPSRQMRQKSGAGSIGNQPLWQSAVNQLSKL